MAGKRAKEVRNSKYVFLSFINKGGNDKGKDHQFLKLIQFG